jgi:alpha-glucosidase
MMMQNISFVKTDEWWKKAVFYQIYPRSFMDSNGDGLGDLAGITSRLDYLNDGTTSSLGVDAIWLSPFFTSPDYDYGYDIADYCAVDPRFGTIDDFDRLLEEAHKRNIKVMLDLVVNHTSHLHPWFLESRSSKDNPKRDWYVWKDGRGDGKRVPNNWRNNFFGPAWTLDDQSGQYYLHSFLKEQPDLNWNNMEVRQAINEVLQFWLDRGVDGFRLDVAHIYCKDDQFRDNPPFYLRTRDRGRDTVPRSDRLLLSNIMKYLSLPELQVRKYNQHQPETHDVLKGFRRIFDFYPAVTSVGEIIGDDPAEIASYYGENSDELHMNFYFELLHCRWKAGAFRSCIDRWEKALPQGAWPAYTLSNHDVTRAVSRYAKAGDSGAKAKLLLLLLLTLRGAPFIYYGEEIAMKEAVLSKENLKDPVGIRWYPLHRGRDGCRTPMQWNNTDYAGFSEEKPWLPVGPDLAMLNVADQEIDSRSQLNFTRQLIWLRKDLPALLEGSYRSITENLPADCFCYLRQSGQQKVLICLNFSADTRQIQSAETSAGGKVLFSTDSVLKPGSTAESLTLNAYQGCLVEIN